MMPSFLGQWGATLDHFVHLLVAFVLALPIGWHRAREEQSAGLRTFPLVAMRVAPWCSHQSRWLRERLHLPLRPPSVEVRRHPGGGDRYRSHRPAAAGGECLHRRRPPQSRLGLSVGKPSLRSFEAGWISMRTMRYFSR